MKNTLICILLLMAGTGLALNVSADGHGGEQSSPPNLAEIWIVKPQSGHSQEFEAALRDHIAERKKAGDPRAWQTYTVEVGEDIGTYGVRYCCFDWADQDAYHEWSRGTELQKHWNENVHPHVASYEHYFDVIDHENSHWPADGGGWNFVGVTKWRPKSGEGMARRAALSKMTGTAKEHGWEGRWVFMNSVGGPESLLLAVPFDNYADMAPPEVSFYEFMSEHLGEEEAQAVFNQFSSSFWGSEYTIYRLRHDLSTPTGDQ